ncbi:MAG: kelch repeat-containing protein, partial [Sorangiineae bacterium]|nr:kelch repeat-containing protein [Sorangiineae bacterium]
MSTTTTRPRALAWLTLLTLVLGCGAPEGLGGDEPDASTAEATTLSDSASADAELTKLRARFVRAPVARAGFAGAPREPSPDAPPRPAIDDGVATSFERVAGGVRPIVPKPARGLLAKTATVTLPERAGGAVRVEDDASQVAVSFALEAAGDAGIAVAGGLALYADAAPGGGQLVHRPHAEGTEDHVVFEARPAREELRYAVDVSRVAGLRLVGNALEFLDNDGTPRLRIAPPSVVDAHGETHAARLAVEGCAVDTDPRAPWGRAVTAPGAKSCGVRVAWGAVVYPAVVDPNWTATGSLVTGRSEHTASVLGSGKVLVAGGNNGGALASAELYDPTTGTWAATGSLATGRRDHTASVLGSGKVL